MVDDSTETWLSGHCPEHTRSLRIYAVRCHEARCSNRFADAATRHSWALLGEAAMQACETIRSVVKAERVSCAFSASRIGNDGVQPAPRLAALVSEPPEQDLSSDVLTVDLLRPHDLWRRLRAGEQRVWADAARAIHIDDEGMWDEAARLVHHARALRRRWSNQLLVYAVAGSTTRGERTVDSDLDVFVVVDDSQEPPDATRQRSQMRSVAERLWRGLADERPVRRLNLQVYGAAQFCARLSDAHPIFTTLVEDSAPLIDVGLLRPWRTIIADGRLAPSPSAIERRLRLAEFETGRLRRELRACVTDYAFRSVVAAFEALLMGAGRPATRPHHAARAAHDVVVALGLPIDQAHIDTLATVVEQRKRLEAAPSVPVGDVTDLAERCEAAVEAVLACFERTPALGAALGRTALRQT